MDNSEKREYIHQLSIGQRLEVLDILMEKEPRLTQKIYDLALEVAEASKRKVTKSPKTAAKVPKAVDIDDVAEKVYMAIYSLRADEMYRRSGKKKKGFVEIWEAADEMIENAIEPFFVEFNEVLKHGSSKSAKAYCLGFIKGLKKSDGCNEVVRCLEDWIEGHLDDVVSAWYKVPHNEDDNEEIDAEHNIFDFG
jgi:hypothetical protein